MKAKTLFITEKLELRLPELEFADSIFHIVKNQRPYLEKWLTWVSQTKTVEDCEKHLKSYRLFNQGGQKLTTFIFFEKKLIGSIALVKINKENHSAEIGYWIDQNFEGKGIVTQSCKRIVRYTFKKMNINRIEISAAPSNPKSISIAKKLGFQYEGTLRDALFIHEKYYDLEKYSLLRKEW